MENHWGLPALALHGSGPIVPQAGPVSDEVALAPSATLSLAIGCREEASGLIP